MNFMGKGNTNTSRDDFYNYVQNNSEMRLMTTSTTNSISSQLGEDMINPVFSSTNWASSPSSSSSTTTTTPLPSSPPNNLYQQQQQQQQYGKYYTTTRGTGIETRTSQLDFMDASPAPSDEAVLVEREHMFDKVVTPSDVGKLNRLVIPKQHAEKYFPLDSSTNDKGLLLNFEDVATAKLWRFRYSYWNSSQSYVMTKGWSRFVKEKKLDPGDIVSFHRAKAKLDRLFIDCTHRPPPTQLINSSIPFPSNMNFSIHPARYFPGNRSSPTMLGWSNSTCPPGIILPAHAATPLRGGGGGDQYSHPVSHNPNWRTNGYNNNYYGGNTNYSHNHPSGSSVIYYKATSSFSPHQHHNQIQQQEETSSSGMMRYASLGSGEMGSEGVDRQLEQVLLHSVPVVQGKAAAKRLRLFGVNMDCPISNNDDDDDDVEDITILPSTTIGLHHNINAGATLLMPPPPTSIAHLVQLRLNNNTSGPSSSHHHHSQFQSD